MGKTLAEKILARCAGLPEVNPGDIINAKVDCAMGDDALGPWFIDAEMKELGIRVWDPGKTVIISDHLAPSGTIHQAETVAFTARWAKEYNVDNYFEGVGPCHQILAENGFDLPGTLLVGTDSHTCTAGAFGCFGTGIGSTELLGVLATGEIWLRVPESLLVSWEGQLPQGVMAKDLILRTIKDVGHAGATYLAMEFSGSVIQRLPMDERMCISNMAVEAGAKAGLIAADRITEEYLARIGNTKPYYIFASDADANYLAKLAYRAEDLVPQVACPHAVDNVADIDKVAGTPMQRAYIGSCTGGRMTDLMAAAEILKGKKVSRECKLLVSPSSQEIWKQASSMGILNILVEAGATILAPTCGACVGLHSGVIAAGQSCVSTTNRNFKGRMGSNDSFVYLASAATVAASAIEGKLADPRAYRKEGRT
ncbi:MAG: 3-isopropylmalate dehydratase large subunit [Sporomusaceae bacterium]|nr:3-isopropylmalate dehydratase large subunit [Sporomusaceae bacterium]